MVDVDPAFGEEFLQIPVGQSVAQVTAHRQQDDRSGTRNPANADGISQGDRTSATLHRARLTAPIVALRRELAGQGLDAGPETIAWRLRHHHQTVVSRVR